MAQKWPLPLSLRPALTKHSLSERLWRTLLRQLFSWAERHRQPARARHGPAAPTPRTAGTSVGTRVNGTQPTRRNEPPNITRNHPEIRTPAHALSRWIGVGRDVVSRGQPHPPPSTSTSSSAPSFPTPNHPRRGVCWGTAAPHLVLEVGVVVHDPLVDVREQQLLLRGGEDGGGDEGDVGLRGFVPGLRQGPGGCWGAAGCPVAPLRQQRGDGEGGPGWALAPGPRVPHVPHVPVPAAGGETSRPGN